MSRETHPSVQKSNIGMHVRRLQPEDAAVFQAFRLAALLDAPTAFGSSFQEEKDFPSESFGFKRFGHEPGAMRIDGELHDELPMVLRFTDAWNLHRLSNATHPSTRTP